LGKLSRPPVANSIQATGDKGQGNGLIVVALN
jgi:hypothetical protein